MMPGLAILSMLIVLYGAVALRLERWSISMPMMFVAVGFLLGPGGTGILHVSPQTEVVKVLTEITLGLLLFADASTLMGWFGPPGLVSVVFTLLAFVRLEQAGQPIDTLEAVATWTILLSVLAHGLSAQPLSGWYAHRLKAAGGTPVALVEHPEKRQRHKHTDIVA